MKKFKLVCDLEKNRITVISYGDHILQWSKPTSWSEELEVIEYKAYEEVKEKNLALTVALKEAQQNLSNISDLRLPKEYSWSDEPPSLKSVREWAGLFSADARRELITYGAKPNGKD